MAAVLRFTSRNSVRRVVFGRALLRRLLEITAVETCIPTHEILGPSQEHEVAHARFAIVLVAMEAGLTSTRVGDFFGRDHSTIISGRRRALELLCDFRDFATLIAKLREAAE